MKQATAIASVSNIAALNHNSKEKGMNYDELVNEANSQTVSPVDYLETHAACHLLLSFPRSFFCEVSEDNLAHAPPADTSDISKSRTEKSSLRFPLAKLLY